MGGEGLMCDVMCHVIKVQLTSKQLLRVAIGKIVPWVKINSILWFICTPHMYMWSCIWMFTQRRMQYNIHVSLLGQVRVGLGALHWVADKWFAGQSRSYEPYMKIWVILGIICKNRYMNKNMYECIQNYRFILRRVSQIICISIM